MLSITYEVMSESEVLKTVAWRLRICSYLFGLGWLWILAAFIWLDLRVGTILLGVGFGIFSSSVALTLAIYRCPVCDRYWSAFRPDSDKCPRCGATVRRTANTH
jgi:hypothetical protein